MTPDFEKIARVLLGEVAGGGTYEQLLPHSEEISAFGRKFLCVSLERLI